MDHFDIAIIGGGIAGQSLAAFLPERFKVVVLEQEQAPGYHSTGRSAAEFTLGYNPPEVCALASFAKPFFDAPPQGFSDTALLKPLNCLFVADQSKADRYEAALAEARDRNPAVRKTSQDEALAIAPILKREAFSFSYFDPDFWTIEVENLLQGYRRMARRKAVEWRYSSAVTAASRGPGGWVIETGKDRLSARIVVNAAGGWVDPVAQLFGKPALGVVPHRRTAILVEVPGDVPVANLPEIGEIDDSFYIKPDGGRLLCSPCDATPCEPADVQPEDIDIAWAAHHIEENTIIPVRRVFKSWAGMRSFAPDHLPVIGWADGDQDFFWLAGQGGFGIQTSPAIAALAASLLAGEAWPERAGDLGLSPATFLPARLG